MLHRTTPYIAIVAVCVGIPLFFEWATTPSPVVRKVHIETFRYGTSPSIIRANRGDRLVLSFSTHDTAHSFFLQDYRIDAKIAPAAETVEVRDPLLARASPVDVREVRLTAGMPGLWGRLVSVSRFRCHVYCGPMHGFEQGDLIVRPNWLMTGSIGLLVAILVGGYLHIRRGEPLIETSFPPSVDLNQRIKLIDKLLKWRPLQFVGTLPVLAGFTLVVMAGLFGTKVAGRNIATMLTWAVWISMLTIFLVPLFGRIWCMICPLPVLGEYLQRGATMQVRAGKGGNPGNHFFGLGRRWPKAFRGPWLRLLIFLGLGTFIASLAGQPHWTALTLLTLAAASILISLVWELRAFCRYVCPIASYISTYSVAGRLMVRKRNAQICRNCKKRSCLTGNDKGWACPYGLCVAGIDRNVDCGICTECFKSCPYDNVSLAWRRGPWTERFTSYGEAWQVIVLLVLAVVYSVTVHSPWQFMRDIVNVIDKATWPEFGLYAMALWTLALGVVPLLFWVASDLGIRIGGKEENGNLHSGFRHAALFSAVTGSVFRHTMPALIPLGMAFWASFFVSTIMVNFTFILLTFSDPFGWGWDLLGTAGMPWVQIWPSGIPWIQAGLTLSGLAFSLRRGYRLWLSIAKEKKRALRGLAPTAVILIAITTGMLVYFTNY